MHGISFISLKDVLATLELYSIIVYVYKEFRFIGFKAVLATLELYSIIVYMCKEFRFIGFKDVLATLQLYSIIVYMCTKGISFYWFKRCTRNIKTLFSCSVCVHVCTEFRFIG